MSAPAAWTGAEASPPLSGCTPVPEPPVSSATTGFAPPGRAAAEFCVLCPGVTLGELIALARVSMPPAPASMVGSVAMDTGPPVVVTLASGALLRSR